MNKYNFLFTDDNSVGLYNNIVKDIYHSKTGAYTEAMEKFIIPSLASSIIGKQEEIKILDICYGIGYNTKAALNFLSKDKKIIIDALEYDKSLVILSPLLKDNICNDELKVSLIEQLLKNNIDILEIEKIMSTVENDFLSQNISEFIKKICFEGYKYNPQENKNSFLHNIYYNYISYSMKYGFKSTNNSNFIITFHFDDARRSIKSLNKIYDIVFLDAFSSQKDPTLWTINFLSAVKDKMNKNSILVSYSKSTPFRSALLELGFSVGKTFINEIDMGTVASLNCENIKSKLSPYDIELLSTRSGITYKDSNLNLSAKEILNNREIEQKNSNRLSHTAFLKLYSK